MDYVTWRAWYLNDFSDEANDPTARRTTMGWIGVDLDGTLAKYNKWVSLSHIGEPIWPMLYRVINWLDEGVTVKIMTARVSREDQKEEAEAAIKAWCKKYIGRELEITCCKDYEMVELWDDRAVQVLKNSGIVVDAVSLNQDV